MWGVDFIFQWTKVEGASADLKTDMARVMRWTTRIWWHLGAPFWALVALCVVTGHFGYKLNLSWQHGLSFEPATGKPPTERIRE
jgi:hypothetical protein